mmetsp:Transcript_70015/g.116278  ORF Transcript_70015/g.116278 Transcript_70015/m.116278 type:complete len:217 (-) Transcript_70015:85-735(-)|eukprot:CAMPEP_0119346560 /NCGR_PEP_ID=MMETSP1333-20130426/108065_1 /TAXON_ID=418940 /ORGANISM="Scyphosphaera apsteinii, Strain RCC1455" /LENGTH=216 /DNA_ID=CAMNT_0007359063 /DNA_START=15 /DNA_END=665 /DNA_ORIENTATION=-
MSMPVLFYGIAASTGDGCKSVSTYGNSFNLTEWVRASWYIQEQQVTGYQPLSALFCVVATYELEGKHVPFSSAKIATVYNYGNIGQVNGPLQNADNMTLCARANNADPSKLSVAPCFLPNIFAGPYWVLAIGEAKGVYEWAIVIGGQPSEHYADGCTTKESGINNAGLWLFTRKEVAPVETVAKMKAVLQQNGIATSRLHAVSQQGCKYFGARRKS